MIHSKAIDVLKTFTKEELKQFSDFVRSPFFNKNKNLIILFDELMEYHPGYDVTNERIYVKVSSGKAYNHNNLRKLMSEMFTLLERYLIQAGFTFTDDYKEKYLFSEYRNRQLNNLFLLTCKKFEVECKNNKSIWTNHYEKSLLQKEIIQFDIINNRLFEYVENTYKKSEYDFCYYLVNLFQEYHNIYALKSNAELKNRDSIPEIFLKFFDYKSFLNQLPKSTEETDFIELVLKSVNLFLKPYDGQQFKYLKGKLIKNSKNVSGKSLDLIQYLITYLESYCIINIKKGDLGYRKELFELYKFEVSFMKDGMKGEFILVVHLYTELVKLALRLNEVDWCQEFINLNIKHIIAKDRDNCYNYGKAQIEFAKNNFADSLKYASLYNGNFLVVRNEMAFLKLRCLFELNYTEQFFALINSLGHFQLYKKESEFYSKDFKIMLNVYNKLMKIKSEPEKANEFQIDELKQIVMKANVDKSWYLEKLKELEKLILKTAKAKREEFYKTA